MRNVIQICYRVKKNGDKEELNKCVKAIQSVKPGMYFCLERSGRCPWREGRKLHWTCRGEQRSGPE
jgi:hypothetical protein